MATHLKNLSEYNEDSIPAANQFRFGLVVSEWNHEITHALYEGCITTLLKHGAIEDNIHVIQVPGAFELPTGARMIAGSENIDAIICLGCVIKGETRHDDYINHAVAHGLVTLSLAINRPVIFGVITTDTEQQAKDRAGGKHGNKGVECAVAAIRMADLRKSSGPDKAKIGF